MIKIRFSYCLSFFFLLMFLKTEAQQKVVINDAFWTPKLKQWAAKTSNDVLDKFEAKHKTNPEERLSENTFTNFDDVANGKAGTGKHAGLPWFDGLVYESIRGIGDLLKIYPDNSLKKRVDGYIDRIYAAQMADADGYINTWTQLIEPNHRWGDGGGFLRWQHDVYNAGMLVEAGVHYYKATGEIKLLKAAVKMANHLTKLIGPAPRRNIVPAHSGPEEALMKLYWLFKADPGLEQKIDLPVSENAYYDLAKFWVENRGNHSGYPHWMSWGNGASEKWIKDQKYQETGKRPSWGDYAQDSISVFKQNTIEGHAVRATLFATGIAAIALENKSPEYLQTLQRLWTNMVGKKMFITGGIGAIHNDEKFGPDYFLPTDAYLETCAAVGAGFFHDRMFHLTHDAKYIDELERVLYNSLLTGISLSGDRYTYQNPLNAHGHERWEWHSCPCCPPMFLKMVSSLPEYIYSLDSRKLFVNLFVGSDASFKIDGNTVSLSQKNNYPWQGNISITVNPARNQTFPLLIRIPGWARGIENPFGLYKSNLNSGVVLKVNGKPSKIKLINGYAEVMRNWKKGDRVELLLPMQPRYVSANEAVKDLKGLSVIASGPFIYAIEAVDNAGVNKISFKTAIPLTSKFDSQLLKGVKVINASSNDKAGKKVLFTAIPYYAIGNRKSSSGYKVWVPSE